MSFSTGMNPMKGRFTILQTTQTFNDKHFARRLNIYNLHTRYFDRKLLQAYIIKLGQLFYHNVNNTNNVIFQSLRRPNKKFDRMLLYKSIFEDEAAKCHTTINAFHLQNHIGIYFYHESHHQKITIHLQLRFA